ncbi:aa3-type cytochrome c oxidase subunit IV [Sphingorhabdus lutea]
MAFAEQNYVGFLKFLKWGSIATAIIVTLVVMIIS